MDQSAPPPPSSSSSSETSIVIDPVCGMSVELEAARPLGLTHVHAGAEYGFCGRGCRLEFQDDPDRFLAPDYRPSM